LILATLVCGEEVRDKFGTVNLVILRMFDLANNGKTQEASKMWPEYVGKLRELEAAIRNELSMTK
jgi:hypothetical protein